MISGNAKAAFAEGLNVRFWDFIFYLTFGVVVTNSVRIAGVLLVFSYLVIPSVCAMFLANSLRNRLILGWVIGLCGSMLGMAFSYYLDFPTGASIVSMLGFVLIVVISFKGVLSRRVN